MCYFSFQSEITKGSVVYIRNSDKNSIKASGDGDPSILIRLSLIALYGRETLVQNKVTALGTKAGTMGIEEHVRKAILGKHILLILLQLHLYFITILEDALLFFKLNLLMLSG